MNSSVIDIASVITASTSIVGMLIMMISYFSQKMKDAKEQGALENRVTQVEASLKACVDTVATVAESHNMNAQSLAKQEAAIEYIKAKMDDMVLWHTELAKTMHEISGRLRNS